MRLPSPQGAHRSVRLFGLLAALTLAFTMATPAHAAGTTWYVTTATDLPDDGDLTTHSGSLRFALTHAIAGDIVSFAHYETAADTIFITSPLDVPSGVAVGQPRAEPCGSYTRPLVNLQATDAAIDPLVRLGAGATLRNVDLGGGRITVRIVGEDADICGVGLGVVSDGDGNTTPLPPWSRVALSIDGARATIHRNRINGQIVVSVNSSGTRIGDALDGSGDGNDGVRDASVTVLADATSAAQRVTIRDPFPRALHGLAGDGMPGGDDNPAHANNWALTPTITSATTNDNFATVEVRGIASPRSLIDIFFDTQVDVIRQAPVVASDDGSFRFSGALPGPTTLIITASTLNDPAHPGRIGSASQWSSPATVQAGPGKPLLAATAALADRDRPGGLALPGDHLRFTVVMTSEGALDVTNIRSLYLDIPPALQVTPDSGALTGGRGFVATDSGFRGGTLASGAQATYTLDATLAADAGPGMLVISGEVAADGIVTIPIVARLRVGAAAPSRAWLPLVVHDSGAPMQW